MLTTTARNATLADLVEILKSQQGRKVDVVAPASKIRSENGLIVVEGAEVQLDDSGVTPVDGRYLPTAVFDEGVADKLSIPLAYVRRLRAERVDLYDANLNGWLHGPEGGAPDARKFLFRAFRGDDGVGVARALLSDSYRIIENLDVLTAALDGVRQAGVSVDIQGADLTDRRMYVRITSPEVQALAPELLKNYRSPFSGDRGADNPTVFAGFVLSNSETGGGAFTIVPRLVVQVCTNGMTITKDAFRNVHLGGKLDEGVVRWSDETQRKNLELVTAKTKDAVATFLDADYVKKVIAETEEQSGAPLSNAVEVVQSVTKKLAFDEETSKGILDMFVAGGDLTAGGVMQAVTAQAQNIDDADKAYEVEAAGLRALELAYAAS